MRVVKLLPVAAAALIAAPASACPDHEFFGARFSSLVSEYQRDTDVPATTPSSDGLSQSQRERASADEGSKAKPAPERRESDAAGVATTS